MIYLAKRSSATSRMYSIHVRSEIPESTKQKIVAIDGVETFYQSMRYTYELIVGELFIPDSILAEVGRILEDD